MKVDLVYLRGSQIMFYILPDMLSKAPMFNRITLWKKYKGHPPQVGIAKGQSAAIVKKCTMPIQFVLVQVHSLTRCLRLVCFACLLSQLDNAGCRCKRAETGLRDKGEKHTQ
jgi:hypothetical protein